MTDLPIIFSAPMVLALLREASEITADPVPIRAHHSGTQLMHDLKGGFVSCEAKLALKLECRYARSRGGYEVSTPKPYCERRMRALHNRVGGQGCILAALPAAQHAGPRLETERLALFVAMRALKALGPACAFKVSGTRLVVREQSLELRQRAREGQMLPLEHVGMRGHGSLLLFAHRSQGFQDSVVKLDPVEILVFLKPALAKFVTSRNAQIVVFAVAAISKSLAQKSYRNWAVSHGSCPLDASKPSASTVCLVGHFVNVTRIVGDQIEANRDTPESFVAAIFQVFGDGRKKVAVIEAGKGDLAVRGCFENFGCEGHRSLLSAYAPNMARGIVGDNRIDRIGTTGGMRGTQPDKHAMKEAA
jgi:hypothetical protein